MEIYKGLTAAELEKQYNLRALRPDFETSIVADWTARSAAQREAADVRLDLAYGEGEREKLDLFSARGASGPLLIYIHGGYWQRGDKSMYSFISPPFIAHGVSVAVLNYNLCPSVRLAAIAPQVRRAIAWLWRNAGDLGFSREQLYVMGHSAGGHLTGAMMATDWTAEAPDLPADLIRGGIPISALFELVPLLTTSINEAVGMDEEEALANSPSLMPLVSNAPQLVVVGGAETPEFHRQADDYCAQFGSAERRLERYSVPEADHFDELNRLAEDDSPFFAKTLALIQG